MDYRVLGAIAFLLAGAALASGCGGGEEATGAAPLTKAAFVRKADALCKAREERLGKEVEDLYEKYGQTPAAQNPDWEPIHEVAVKTVLARNLEGEIEELRALGEPAGGKIPVDEIVTVFQKVIHVARTDPHQFLEEIEPYAKAEKIAEKYGMENCPVR